MGSEAGIVEKDLDSLTDLFRLLSDKTRMKILVLLADGERNVSSLCEELGLPQPTVSHHLGLLRLQSIISNRRSGKQVFYQLNGRVELGAGQTLNIGAERYSVRIAPTGK